MQTNNIGIEKVKAELLIEKLADLMANYSVFYQNVRGYHWNIKGEKFFELHVKFEELYNDLVLKIDELAERILTLGGSSEHRFSAYLAASAIKEIANSTNGKSAVEDILSAFKVLIIKQREILAIANDANDEGTNALMSDYIRAQEKLVWMYSAFLEK